MSLIINMFAGPGSGKSTTAFGLTHLLKARGVSAEFAQEWIKNPVWQGRTDFPQYYVWAKQQKLIDGLVDKVDVIVTDSPTLLSLVYGDDEPNSFRKLVVDKFFSTRRLDVYIDRVKPFFQGGRYQDEKEARELDTRIHWLFKGLHPALWQMNIAHTHVAGDEKAPELLAKMVQDML